MADANSREKELVLAPNEYAYIMDKTKGNVGTYVGAHKVSLSGTDSPVVFDYRTKRFVEYSLEQAIQVFATAPEGWYLILKNPAEEEKNAHPKIRSSNDLTELRIGQKVNIPGPASFPLWPGQMAKIVKGHNLRSNEYLVVRIYDEDAAKDNWKSAVIKSNEDVKAPEGTVALPSLAIDIKTTPPNLIMGNLLVIKGTDVSFYIPPTGVEVVSEGKGNDGKDIYVRAAVTLERLEYCILLDEDGNKRYVQGPEVVFPEHTETFLEKDGSRKYKAVELSETSGIYVKVIADYKEKETSYITGEELFITGHDQMIYFPRPEHAIIKYNKQLIHHAIAIPKGEARYVLNRETGDVLRKNGPCMFLPDPRKEVIVRRVLSTGQVQAWFPNNNEALAYNMDLATVSNGVSGYVPDNELKAMVSESSLKAVLSSKGPSAGSFHSGDGFERKSTYTPPRSITLDTKYDGAVAINPWTGYAVQVVSKTGDRKVIVGPASCLLEYDETLEIMEMSTGKPKTTDTLLKTAYLRSLNNKIGDIITVQTQDYCDLQLKVSYCVNFEGDKNKWFNAENYVKLLCDHMRSVLRSAAKEYSIQEFYAKSTGIIKDTVLGLVAGETLERPGHTFNENDMHVYDVEVLGVRIMDANIADSLVRAQHESLSYMLDITKLRQNLDFVRERESINQMIEEVKSTTMLKAEVIKQRAIEEKLVTSLVDFKRDNEIALQERKAEMEKSNSENELHINRLEREKATSDARLAVAEAQLQQRIEELKAESDALAVKAGAITPGLISALQSFGDKEMFTKVTQAMSPLAIVGETTVADTVQKLLKGTALEGMANKFLDASIVNSNN